MMRLAIIALAAVLAGCASRIPSIPETARDQPPRAAPSVPWFGQGRMELSVPGKRLSCTAFVRGLGNRQARLVLMSDEGLQLADLRSTADGYDVIAALPDLNKALPHLGRLLRQAFALPPEERSWSDDRIAARNGGSTRWYGGDPVLLREVEGDGLDLVIEDYRQIGPELVPFEARASGPFGITLRIRLSMARLLAPIADATPAAP
jgi:hypothetical protein